LRIRAPIIPAFSATPTPIIATNVTATTAKPAKLFTNDDSMKRMPSVESRLWTSNVCSFRTYSGISKCSWVTSSTATIVLPPSDSWRSRTCWIGTGTATVSVTSTSNAARIVDRIATNAIR
jgi:hypothetical protein